MPGRVIVITGASSGIGAALARRLAADGAGLVLVARREGPLTEVAAACGPGALPLVADMTRRDDARRVADRAVAHFGLVDVWVNNVGRGITRLPSQLTDEDLHEMMQVNVHSALYGVQAILPHFRARGTGHIVNVSSLLGRVAYVPFRSAYAGAKHFLDALTTCLRAELAESDPGITVSIVSPGVVRTAFGANARHGGPDSWALPNSQGAEEVAGVIAGMIETRAPDLYTRAGAREMVVAHYQAHGADP